VLEVVRIGLIDSIGLKTAVVSYALSACEHGTNVRTHETHARRNESKPSQEDRP
jgi:hypothetical protein